MTAEAWPTEEAATKAVDAAARKSFEDYVRDNFPLGTSGATWNGLAPNQQLVFREAVLPVVWAALEALPDPRRVAWFEGWSQASEAAGDCCGCNVDNSDRNSNPYDAQ